MSTLAQKHLGWQTWAVAALVAVALEARAADIQLQLGANPVCAVVRLGDIAKINSADPDEVARLAALPLVPAPATGTHRFLRMREVQDLLAAHGEDMGQLNFQGEVIVQINPAQPAPATVVPAHAGHTHSDRRAIWEGAASTANVRPTVVTAAAAPMPAAALESPAASAEQIQSVQVMLNRLVIDYLSRTSGRKAEWQASLRVDVADVAKVLAAKSPLECSGGNTPWTGKQRLAISFAGDQGPTRIAVYADVTATQPVVVAIRPIDRGHVLTAADVEVQQWSNAPLSSGRREPVGSVEPLIGMEATRGIQAGDPITSEDFRPRLLVKRGDEIAVYSRGGGIQVRCTARARQDGARGELIGVESLEAKEPFDAVVTGVREAVVFSGSPAPESESEKMVQRPFQKLRQE